LFSYYFFELPHNRINDRGEIIFENQIGKILALKEKLCKKMID